MLNGNVEIFSARLDSSVTEDLAYNARLTIVWCLTWVDPSFDQTRKQIQRDGRERRGEKESERDRERKREKYNIIYNDCGQYRGNSAQYANAANCTLYKVVVIIGGKKEKKDDGGGNTMRKRS